MVQKVFDGVSSKEREKKQNKMPLDRKDNFQVWLIIIMLGIMKKDCEKKNKENFIIHFYLFHLNSDYCFILKLKNIITISFFYEK